MDLEASEVNAVSDPFPEKAWRSGLPTKLCCRASRCPYNETTRKNTTASSANPDKKNRKVPAVVLS